MPSGVFAPAQRPRRFNHHLYPSLTPGNFDGIRLRGKRYRFPVHQQRPPLVGHLSRKEAMDGIILEEIGQITEVRTIIDCHNLSVRKSESATQDHTTNTSKTVNTNTTCHTLFLLCCYGQGAQDRQRPLRVRGCSMAAMATSVFNTASGFNEMLPMPCSTRIGGGAAAHGDINGFRVAVGTQVII